ncbi:cobyrinate a,c-diamide synthase [Sphaerimonospora thailandensis]|uniref:Hydrogenobyrinate a,c-diamide synthase n=1 Tax=Sphaerimonospora thailandensis TaxID=795644 RepID=A0A8J3R3S4_9ACTN|nr:cobyrinate a,c-diamide synthase [Sphaerimonospora thailandensis]GIH67855.1 hydrogenobyrinate a,c-diamide synthase [Sphaerimonospora thailandensis]
MVTIPRVVVAAPSSGAGKTTFATGLMAALTGRGLAVSPHKVGPDYIDPGYHAAATGRPGRNLDAFLVGADLVAPLFAYGALGADVAVVEGVMGLFDGRGATGEGSTAHVARLLDAPVLLVVDASAQSSSVAALVHGFATYDRSVRLAGVVLNRVASPRHESILREALASSPVPVLGALPRDPGAGVPSRHLGLVPAQERGPASRAAVDALGALVERHCDVEAITRVASAAPRLAARPWSPADAVGRPVSPGPVVAVAAGAAFTFRYPETIELLEAAGARVATVDPLRDERLPDGTRALVLGGGFPEVHAAELSANRALRDEVARRAADGLPVIAECGGLLYLARVLDGLPMCGVLPVEARMTDRLTIGYREAVRHGTRPDGPTGGMTGGPAGSTTTGATTDTPARAHEFHRTACSPAAGRSAAYTLADGRREGFVQGRVHASYLHQHWAGAPHLARDLVKAAA